MALELRLEAPISETTVPLTLALSGIPYAAAEAEYVDIWWAYEDDVSTEGYQRQFLGVFPIGETLAVPFPQTNRSVHFWQRPHSSSGVEAQINFDQMAQTVFTSDTPVAESSGAQTALFALVAVDEPIYCTTTRTTAWQVVLPANTWTDKGDTVRFTFTGRTAANANNKNLYLKLGLDTIFFVEDYVESNESWRIEGEMFLSGTNQVTCAVKFFTGESAPRVPETGYTVLPINTSFGQNFKFEMSGDADGDVALMFGYGERIPKPPLVPSVDPEYLVDEYGTFLTDEADDYAKTE